jgi:hypothetical protein
MLTPEATVVDGGSADAIFVVGNSRSGTTMLGRILGRHPLVHTLPEIHFFEELWSPEAGREHWSRDRTEALLARLASVVHDGYFTQGDAQRYASAAAKIADQPGAMTGPVTAFMAFLQAEASTHGKTIPCDQTPRNVFYLEEILHNFPRARVISLVRDPRDVLASQKGKWKRRFLGAGNIPLKEALRAWANYHPLTMTRLWLSAVRAALACADHPRVLILRFESLLNDPEKTLAQLGSFLGIDVSADMLVVPQVGSSASEDRPDRTGIDAGRTGQWRTRLDPAAVFLCQRLAQREMDRFGYPQADVRPNPLAVGWLWLSCPLKLGLALMLNLSRVSNLKDTLRRRLVRRPVVVSLNKDGE